MFTFYLVSFKLKEIFHENQQKQYPEQEKVSQKTEQEQKNIKSNSSVLKSSPQQSSLQSKKIDEPQTSKANVETQANVSKNTFQKEKNKKANI